MITTLKSAYSSTTAKIAALSLAVVSSASPALAEDPTPIEEVFALVDIAGVESQVMLLAGVAIMIVLVAFGIRIVRRFLR